jgi:signal transduction histidine kinase
MTTDVEIRWQGNLQRFVESRHGSQLIAGVETLSGLSLRLLDERERVIYGNAEHGLPNRISVRVHLDPIGYIESDGPAERAAAAARIIEHLLRSDAQYRMASQLHLHAVRSDYEQLKEKHEALLASEARYRDLAAQLDERVKEQIRTIEATQRQLYQSEKMAAVGQLAAGIAHEINTPIGFIRSNLHTALDYREQLADALRGAGCADGADLAFVLDDLRDLLKESIEGTDRVGRIVAALKDFSHVDRAAMAPTDLNEIIRSVREVLAPEVAGRVDIALELDPLPAVRCHVANMGQVFYNLLLNAVQAVEETGVVRVRSTVRNDCVMVTIEDDGVGIAPEHLARVHEPFFTTREVGKGTGLGITVSDDIVQAHGGDIRIDSTLGRGTCVTVKLPLGNTSQLS